ncbi:MAG: 2-oxoacid:acceptor oxidoreductase family protein [Bradymonadales bacterium]|nr:2-oxoacid:acceptor oxidoreductase family protein [Bradymonadales bacterium]
MTELRFAGFGGQGIILAGMIVGQAAAIHDNKFATLTQNFGPEARGGACYAGLIISDREVMYPYVHQMSLLVAMSQEAYLKFAPDLVEGGSLLYESELVNPGEIRPTIKAYGIPATRLAEEIGRSIVQNIVMVGFFTAITGLISFKAALESLRSSVPPSTFYLNRQALKRGYHYGLELLGKSDA